MTDFDLGQLKALSAAATEGTLDAAASVLDVTPSAISQRLKALEIAAGAVLLVRTKPIQVTASGQILLRLARQVELLTSEADAELRPADSTESPTIPLAINADSLATWALPALAPLADDFRFDLYREDQAHTAALLRSGSVMAAITSQAAAVPGCRVTPLGHMRYRPMATPTFVDRWFGHGVSASALTAAPAVTYDRKDEMQLRYLRRRKAAGPQTPVHYVPSSADFVRAVALGFGWGMVPDLQSAELEKSGQLVDLDPRGAADVALFWQQWQLRSPALDRVTDSVVTGARRSLAQPARTRGK